jgi:hypothetical protein
MGLSDCTCFDCQMSNKYNDNPPDHVVLAAGGCPYCSMMGYEDYPRSKKPCRLGHKEPLGPLLSPMPEPIEDRPKVGGPWKWTGRGWKNLGYKRKDA